MNVSRHFYFARICRSNFINYYNKMSAKESLDRIKQNAEIAKQTISELKTELNVLNKEYNNILTKQLKEENAKLIIAVEEAKKRLIDLEIKNGVKQIPLPNDTTVKVVSSPALPNVEQNESTEKVKKVTKEAKPKKEKVAKESKNPPSEELPIDIGRLDLRIGKVEDVQRHPDADTLYLLKVNCGEDKPRTVCSGLVKHVPIEELQNRFVLVLCNLKPVKMRGIMSEAMVMCASSEQGVEVLLPPAGCAPGDLVNCKGFIRQPDAIMNPKKKIFETVAPDLHTNDQLQACYKGIPLAVENGFFTAKTLKNVPVK